MTSTLRNRSEFDRVFRTGRRHRVGGIVTIVAPGREGEFRYGLVAGKKVGGAVERNRVKRRIRHALHAIPAPSGVDLVVIASPAVLHASFSELVRWLATAVVPSAQQSTNQEKLAP